MLTFGTKIVRFELYQARTFGADIMVAHMTVDLVQSQVIKLDFWQTFKSQLTDPNELYKKHDTKYIKMCFPFRKQETMTDQYLLLALNMKILGPQQPITAGIFASAVLEYEQVQLKKQVEIQNEFGMTHQVKVPRRYVMSQEIRDIMKHLWPLFNIYWYIIWIFEFHDPNESLKFMFILTAFLMVPEYFFILVFPMGLLLFSSYGSFRKYRI